jgi:autotransporter translocation and assembly factor TamB
LFRWLTIIILTIFSAVILLLLFLTVSPGEKIIKGIAESKLRDLLGQEVQIGTLETNLLSRFQIQDMRIYRAQAGDTISLLSLTYGRADYALVDLLLHGFSLNSIKLDCICLSIMKDSSGSYNLPLLDSDKKASAAPDSAPLSPPLFFRHLKISNARIDYVDKSVPGTYASLHGLRFVAAIHGDEAYRYLIQVDSAKTLYQGLPFKGTNFQLKGIVSLNELRLDSLSADFADMHLTGHGAAFPWYDPISIRGDFSVKGNPSFAVQIAREHFPDRIPSINGDLDLALHVEGTLEHPKLSGQLDLPVLDISEIHFRNVSIKGELEPGLLSLNWLGLQVLGGRVSAQGQFSTDSLPHHTLSISAEGVDLASVWQSLYGEASPFQGRIRGQVTVFGQSQEPKDWNISAEANLSQVMYYSKPLPDLSTQLTFQQGLAHFRFEQQDSEISGKVRLERERLKGEFSANILKLEPLAGLANVSELTGELQIEGVIGGKIDSPEIEAEITAKDVKYQNFPVDSLVASVVYQKGRAYLRKLTFSGTLDPVDTLQAPFHLSDLRGGINYHGYASGPVDSLKGEMTIKLIQPGYGTIHFDDAILQIVLDDQRISLSSIELRRDSLLIQGTGEFRIPSRNGTCEIEVFRVPYSSYNLEDGLADSVIHAADRQGDVSRIGELTAMLDLLEVDRFSLRMETDDLDIEQLITLLPEPPDVGGLLSFRLDFSGNLDNPDAEFDFHLQEPRFQSVKMDSLSGSFVFEDGQFQLLSLELFEKGHYSKATAVVGLDRREDGSYFLSDRSLFKGQASGRDIDLRLLRPLLPEDMLIAGYASYDLSWNGTLKDLHPVGELRLREGLVRTGENVPPIEGINLSASIKDSLLTLSNLSGVIRQTPFELWARVTASQSRKIDLEMNLSVSNFATLTGNGTISPDSLEFNARIKEMDLSLFQPFFPDLSQLSGALNTELILTGATLDPELDGHLQVRELVLKPLWLDVPFTQGIIKLNFNRNEVKVDSLFMRMNDGTLFVSGKLMHDRGELVNADLEVNLTNLKIHRPKELILLVKSAQLSYKNQNSYYLLDGDIILGESRMLVNFRPQSILPFARAVERPKRELPSFLQQTRMNVRLRESENLWVDNNLARLRLHTELSAIGSPVQPNFTGRVTVEEGYLLYLDRKFKIKQGVVDFVDPERLNPIIDFKAETMIKSYRATEATPYVITLSISGALDEVAVELTSDPPEDKSNILSLLTVGATREQLAGNDAEGEDASVSAILKERARSISSEKIAGYTSRKVGGFLGLEQFTIEGDLFRFDRSWGPQLLASKKISPRMEITYTTTVGHSNENSFRLDYRLSKHFSLEGQTDQQGRAGMNLKYRLRGK